MLSAQDRRVLACPRGLLKTNHCDRAERPCRVRFTARPPSRPALRTHRRARQSKVVARTSRPELAGFYVDSWPLWSASSILAFTFSSATKLEI